MKILFLFSALVVVGLLFIILFLPIVVLDGHIFVLDVAKSQNQQEVGLAKYQSIKAYQAMYFPFTHDDYYTFWMKDMKFPIDILFLRKGHIVSLYSDVPQPQKGQTNLPVYRSTALSDSVLEISAGLSRKYGFHIGDNVQSLALNL